MSKIMYVQRTRRKVIALRRIIKSEGVQSGRVILSDF